MRAETEALRSADIARRNRAPPWAHRQTTRLRQEVVWMGASKAEMQRESEENRAERPAVRDDGKGWDARAVGTPKGEERGDQGNI